MGKIFLAKGDLKNSVAYLQKYTDIDGKNTDAIINLGNTFFQDLNLDEALKCYQKVLKNLESPPIIVYDNLGKIFRNIGDFEQSIKYFKKSNRN